MSSPSRRHHVGTISPALRAYGWQCPQLSGANGDRKSIPRSIGSHSQANSSPAFYYDLIQRCCIRSRRLAFPLDGSWDRYHRYRCWVNGVVLSSLRTYPIRNDTARRRVESLLERILNIVLNCPRLHPTKYPWEHEKFTKTFDHQTYALSAPSTARFP